MGTRRRQARNKKRQSSISVEQVRKGLPIKALNDLARILAVDRAELAEVLGTSVRTLQRKATENERLGPVASDRLARVQRILDLATHVLGKADKASRWLTSASRALDGEVPLQMLDTDIGAQRVQQELRAIEFGMPF
jgi:putative toxin-antitoxin system antitoxin component (TIGR02293 family)